jgi:hypothetical protein
MNINKHNIVIAIPKQLLVEFKPLITKIYKQYENNYLLLYHNKEPILYKETTKKILLLC